MKHKLCCFFNYNPLYRLPIYTAISKEYDADFYFGDNVFEPLKRFDANSLPGFRSYLKARKIRNSFVWHSGIFKTLKHSYTDYVLTGAPGMLANWIIIAFAKISKKKVYCWCHGFKSVPSNGLSLDIAKIFYRMMDGIFLYNNYNIQYMTPLGIKMERIHVIHNSLNSQVQSEIYKTIKSSNIYTEHFKNNDPVLIFIGRIQKRMKVGMIVEAVNKLLSDSFPVNAILVGPYMDGDDISSMVDSYNLGNRIWLYGPAYEEEVTAELLFNADVCVAPGTVGLTAIHSLSYGTPVITHNSFSSIGPEFEAIIDGQTGEFFEENNIESMVSSITHWIGLPVDKRNAIRELARKTIEESWSIEYQIDLLHKVIG